MADARLGAWIAAFALGAAAAAWVWLRPEPNGATEDGSGFALLALDEHGVLGLRLVTPAETIEVARDGDAVRVVLEGGPDAGDHASETFADPHGHDAPPELPRPHVASGERLELYGNERAARLFADVAAFDVRRDLGAPDPGRLAEFGLDDAADSLVVRTTEGEERFALGKTLHGTTRRYARRAADGHIYVLDAGLVDEVDDVGSYVERRLHAFYLSRTDRAVVKARGRELALTRVTERTAQELPRWAPVDFDGNELPDALYGNWLRDTASLYAHDFPAAAAGETAPVVRVEYLRGDERLGFLELFEDLAADEASPERYRARTELGREVVVPADAARAIAQDLGNLFGG